MARKVASKPPLVSKTSHQEPLSREKLPSQPKPSANTAVNIIPAITMDPVPKDKVPNQDLPKEGAAHDDTIEMSFQMRMQEWKHNEEVSLFDHLAISLYVSFSKTKHAETWCIWFVKT